MQTVVLNSESKANLKLITDLAKKIGVSVKYITYEEKEDIGMLKAIKKGRTKKYIETESFLKKLRK